MRAMPRSIAVLMLGATGCAVPAAAPPMLEDPTPLARCAVRKSPESPLVTEWPASEKVHLEGLLGTGAVVVAYDGCTLRLLETCRPSGSYTFHRTSLASDTIEITSVDELYAKLPLGAASLQGALSSAGRINIDTTAVGQLRLEGGGALPDIDACREATHVVQALTIGAFDMRAGGESAASGGIGIGPAGAHSSRRRTARRLRAAGDPSVCARTGDEPDPGCRAPLQLFLTPARIEAPALATQPSPPSPPDEPQPVAITPATAPVFPIPALPALTPSPSSHCLELKAEVVRVARQAPVPLHLPHGGSRVTLRFINDGETNVTLPASRHLALQHRDGDTISPLALPALNLWWMPVELPAHGRRQLDIVVGPGLLADDIVEVSLADVHRGSDGFDTCTMRHALVPHP